MPRPPFCFARPHHLLLSPFSLLPSRVSSTDPSLRGILVTRASAPPSPSIVHPRDPSSSSSSSPSSTFFSFSRRFRFEIFNEKEGIEWNERFDSSCNVRHNVRGEAYGQWEWRRVEKPVAGIERTLLRLVHEYKADDRWPLADSPLGWIVDIGQSESRFTEGGAPLFRKRQNWFVQFSPLYDREGWPVASGPKKRREREREVHPAHREGKHCDGHFFELVQSTGRHCPRHHRYFSSAVSRSFPPRRFVVIVIVIVITWESRDLDLCLRATEHLGEIGEGEGEWMEKAGRNSRPLRRRSLRHFSPSPPYPEPECNSNSVNSGDFSKFH